MMVRFFDFSVVTTMTTIILVIMTTMTLAQTDSSDTYDIEIDDYKKDDTAYDYLDANSTTTTTPSTDDDYKDFGFGYKVKYQGLSNVTHHKSLYDGLLVILADIGTHNQSSGVIRMETTVEEILWEIVQPYDDDNFDDGGVKPKKWILVRPPGDVDVAKIHWERDADGHILLISGPIPNTDPGSSEVTNSTLVFPPSID